MVTIKWVKEYKDGSTREFEHEVDKTDVVDFLSKTLKKQKPRTLYPTTYDHDYKQALKDLFDKYDLDDFIDYLSTDDDDFIEFIKDKYGRTGGKRW